MGNYKPFERDKMTIEEAIERLDYFEPDDLVECAMYRNCVETIKTAYEKEKEKNNKARDMIEYYLIENNSLNDFDKRNKELKKLEKVLEE